MLRTGLMLYILFLLLSVSGHSGQTKHQFNDVALQKNVYQRTVKLMGSRFDLTVWPKPPIWEMPIWIWPFLKSHG